MIGAGMQLPMQDIVIGASTPRRVFMLVAFLALGTLLVALGLGEAPLPFGWRVALVGLGGVVLAFLPFVWRTTGLAVKLIGDRIEDSRGRVICELAQIEAVERGAFAFKPSNGFLLRLKTAHPRAWAPGIWWRFGRKVGVGGVLPAGQTKFMADMVSVWISEAHNDRDG